MASFSGTIFCATIFLAAALAIILETFVLMVVLPLPTWISRTVIGRFSQMWFRLANFLLIHLLNHRVLVHGDGVQLQNKESALIISNHPTRIDWMLLWPLFGNYGVLPELKIVLKSPLRKIPAIGWHIQLAKFIFLERNLEKDKPYIQKSCRLLAHDIKNSYKPIVLMFPEGTDLSCSNVAKGHLFAEKKGLQKYHRVLHPRTTGLRLFFDGCKQANFDALYDFTISYTENPFGRRPSEKSILENKMPHAMHVHIKRYDMKVSRSSLFVMNIKMLVHLSSIL